MRLEFWTPGSRGVGDQGVFTTRSAKERAGGVDSWVQGLVGPGIQISGSEGIRIRNPNTCVCVKYEFETRNGRMEGGRA